MASMDQYADTYREEAGELLAELEATLLEMEEAPDDADLVARAFRAMHTIKGSGAMFGFDEIASFTHELETVFDKVRNGEVPVDRDLVGLALRGKDLIRALLDGGTGTGPERERLVAELRRRLPGAAAPAPAPAAPTTEVLQTYRIRFRLGPGLFQDEGASAAALLDDLRRLGPCTVVPQAGNDPGSEGAATGATCAAWDVILSTSRGANAVRDVFIFVEDRCDLRIDLVDDGETPEASYKRLGEILLERGDLSADALEAALRSQKRIGDLLEEQGVVPPEAVRAAAAEQQVVRQVRAQRESSAAQAEAATSIRVAAEKLDSLVDLVGELVIAQARLSQISKGRLDPDLLGIAEEIERLAGELRDNTLNIRMLPIGTTFGKFKRLVRDLSGELGKEIELVTEGADTELDKTVIERLGDPLVHLIRNSCDHGVERPEVREAAGKPRAGTVRLSAYHSGPHVFVEIRDDGAGLDPEALRAKGIERGLVAPDAKLSDRELYNLIFLPGFSTAKAVSAVSGRGVGMDVVKRAIEALRGTVEIESARGAGTTVRVRLPLTLAIIEGLLVAVGRDRFVLPLSLVEECVELTAEDVERAHGSRLAAVRGELVPYLRLRETFGIQEESRAVAPKEGRGAAGIQEQSRAVAPKEGRGAAGIQEQSRAVARKDGGDTGRTRGGRPPIEQIVIANVEGQRFGFAVDHVVGQHQTVIKSLGNMYRNAEGLSGATILGDGTVALILDVPKLVQAAGAAARH